MVQATGEPVPAGKLRRRRRLARPSEGVQQHHLLGVERPVHRQQRVVAAEKPRIGWSWYILSIAAFTAVPSAG
jgi:hypothetical protein